VLQLSYPTTTASGLPLGRIEAVRVLATPSLVEGSPEQVPEREWEKRAQVLVELRGQELSQAIDGGKIAVQVPLASPASGTVLVLAAKTQSRSGEWSGLSNRVALPIQKPPPSPEELELALEPGGVRVRWKLPLGEFSRVRVYRRLAEERRYGQPIAELPRGSVEFFDHQVVENRRYLYTVTLLDGGTPPVESALQLEREILVEDRFPPAPPSAARALAEPGRVRLLWEASPDPDVVGYLVERQEPDGDTWRSLFEGPLPSQSYEDKALASGLRLRYRIRAVDKAGNQSRPSDPIEVLVP
jgi:hypothetical protein